MGVLKVIGWIAAGGILLAGSIGGVMWWRNRQRKKADTGPTPSNPPRKTEPTNGSTRNKPHHHLLDRHGIRPEIVAEFEQQFGEVWQANDEAIGLLKQGDAVVFVVESEPVEDFDLPVQEAINASVLSVENTYVRARVFEPVAHTHHFGNTAGHGLYVGALVEVPLANVMAAARRDPIPGAPTSGYGSRGEPAKIFKPSDHTKQVYKVHPGTVYELELPYVTENLTWSPSRDMVRVEQIGTRHLMHQIMFTEASVRGPYSLTLLDHDEREGIVFVGKWDFDLAE